MAQLKKKKPINKFVKLVLIIFVIFAIFLAGLTIYIGSMFKSAGITPPTPFPKFVGFNAHLIYQDILYYENGRLFVPYALFNYSATNITSINVSSKILISNPPDHIFVLNWSNECIDCKNITTFVQSLNNSLSLLGITNSTNKVQIINQSELNSLNSSDILFIVNGRMPQYLFNDTFQSVPLIQQVLNNGVTIIYIGSNFSKTLITPSLLIPAQNIPSFLSTSNSSIVGPYKNQTHLFSLTSSRELDYMNYEKIGNGYIIVFSNYLNSFPNMSYASSFFSNFIEGANWIPSTDSAFRTIPITYAPNTYGRFGILFNSTDLIAKSSTIDMLNSYYIKTTITAYSNYNIDFNKSYINKVLVSTNGSIDLPYYASPGVPINSSITLFINQPTFVEPHIDVYNLSMVPISSIAPIFAKNISSTFTYYENFTPQISKGFYIIQINGYQGQHYASGLIGFPPISIILVGGNYTQGRFLFFAVAGGKPVSNINATVKLNDNYSENVTINKGYFIYSLPVGSSVPQGNITFTVSTLGQSASFSSYYKPAYVAINQQYIEFIIALIIVILEVTLIKTPFRDEFFIDVPNLPPPKRMEIKIRDNELINVFNSLNNYYHWRYMPLSKEEFKFAVANNIRINSVPVNLTYENVELILDTLTKKGYLVSVDNLYMPTLWIEQSKHDVEYLATFKKLRTYLVSHGHVFTDIDKSDIADIITTLHNEKAYIIIYSKTSRFLNKLPIQENVKTYLVFLNDDKLDEFKQNLYTSVSSDIEILKMYISTKSIILASADNPEEILS